MPPAPWTSGQHLLRLTSARPSPGGTHSNSRATNPFHICPVQASAYQALLGLSHLPQDGRQAQAASRQLGAVVLPGIAPPLLLSQLVTEELSSRPPVKTRFVDVSTGGRLAAGWGCSLTG